MTVLVDVLHLERVNAVFRDELRLVLRAFNLSVDVHVPCLEELWVRLRACYILRQQRFSPSSNPGEESAREYIY